MKHKKVRLVLEVICWALFAVALVWCFWSWIDLAAHQLDGGTHNPLNLYVILRG